MDIPSGLLIQVIVSPVRRWWQEVLSMSQPGAAAFLRWSVSMVKSAGLTRSTRARLNLWLMVWAAVWHWPTAVSMSETIAAQFWALMHPGVVLSGVMRRERRSWRHRLWPLD